MKRRKATQTESRVRVIPDSRNGSLDYWITREEAKDLYAQGKLDQDLTNSTPGNPVYMPAVGKTFKGGFR